MQSQLRPFSSQKTSSFFLSAGGIVLLIVALSWGVWLLAALLGEAGVPALVVGALVSVVAIVVFLSFPLFALGVLALLIGLAIRLLKVRSLDLAFVVSGLLSTGVGILAIVVPSMLVPAGSGDTEMAWLAGVTVLIAGFPLTFLGVVLIGIGEVKRFRRSGRQ